MKGMWQKPLDSFSQLVRFSRLRGQPSIRNRVYSSSWLQMTSWRSLVVIWLGTIFPSQMISQMMPPYFERGFRISSLRRWPAEICFHLNFFSMSWHWVCFPDPGPPRTKTTLICFNMICYRIKIKLQSQRARPPQTVLGLLLKPQLPVDLLPPLLVVFRFVFSLQFIVLPLQVLVQLLLLCVLPHHFAGSVLKTAYVLGQFLDLFDVLTLAGEVLDARVHCGVLAESSLEGQDLLLRQLLFLEKVGQLLQLIVVALQGTLHQPQLLRLFVQPLQVFAFLGDYLLPSHAVKLLYRHVCGSPPSWLEQPVVKGLLVSNESPLVVYFFLVLHQSLPSDLGLFLFDLLGDQVLESELSPFVEKSLDVVKLFLAVLQVPECDFGLIICLELNLQGLEIELGRMKNIVDFICEILDPFLQGRC